MKRSVVMLLAFALATLPLPAHSEEHGFTCGVTGAATFDPGVTVEPGAFDIAFKGKLSDCESTGNLSSAKVVATAKADATSCAFGETAGRGTVTWKDGKKSSFKFSTTDIGAAVLLHGEVNRSNADAVRKGDDLLSLLVFSADPTLCSTEEGLTKVEFQGQVGGGSPS